MPLSQRRERLLKRLASSRSRAKEGLVLVEGVRAAGEAVSAGAAVSFAVVSPRLDATEDGRALAARLQGGRSDLPDGTGSAEGAGSAEGTGAVEGMGSAGRAGAAERGGAAGRAGSPSAGFELVRVSDAEMDTIADTEHPQGIVLVCEEPRPDLAAALRGARRVLVLDAVQDPGNVGTLVRSAVAFAFDVVVALDGTADPWGSKAVRASAGTVFRVPLVRAAADDVVAGLTAAGLSILVASAEGSAAIDPPEEGFALVVGNEGAGVRDAVREAARATVAVPMTGPAESLNVGIAGSILMSDFTREDRR